MVDFLELIGWYAMAGALVSVPCVPSYRADERLVTMLAVFALWPMALLICAPAAAKKLWWSGI